MHIRLKRVLVVGGAAVAALAVGALASAGTRTADAASGSRQLFVTKETAAASAPRDAARASATWCGTPSALDAKPNVVAGNPVHWIYAIPSDGADQFSNFASRMQTDWETIDGWWRGQDSTRAPRSDLATFSCGNQLDISVVRLPQSGTQLAVPDSPFELIWDAIEARGFNSDFSKYIVYYDGPVGDDRICGVGSTVPNGTGLAVFLAQSCGGVDAGEVVAHELLHALGAVPGPAPNNCPPPDDGHTCDNDRDLMFPFTDGTPLTGLLLDPGRDDYYGHSGSWPDVQDSPWLVQLDRQAPLALTISGPGRIASNVPGLDCDRTCTTTWNSGTRMTLTPTPGPGAKLVRWSGGCSGVSQCNLTVGQGTAATAFFAQSTYRLSVRLSGRGSIRVPGAGIRCPGRCASPAPSYVPLRLTAQPAKGWKLRTWSGACRGSRPTCTVTMEANTSARAVFVRR